MRSWDTSEKRRNKKREGLVVFHGEGNKDDVGDDVGYWLFGIEWLNNGVRKN